jgi:hypothetical protein
MVEKNDFAAYLLRLEQELTTYRMIHQEELLQLEKALDELKRDFLNLTLPDSRAGSSGNERTDRWAT